MKRIEDQIADRLRNIRGGDSQDKEALWAAIEKDLGTTTGAGGSMTWKGAAMIALLFIGTGLTWWGVNESAEQEKMVQYSPRQLQDKDAQAESVNILKEETSDYPERMEGVVSLSEHSDGDTDKRVAQISWTETSVVSSIGEMKAGLASNEGTEYLDQSTNEGTRTSESMTQSGTQPDAKEVTVFDMTENSTAVAVHDRSLVDNERQGSYATSIQGSSTFDEGSSSSTYLDEDKVFESTAVNIELRHLNTLGLVEMTDMYEKAIVQDMQDKPEAQYLTVEKSLWPHYLSLHGGFNQAVLTVSHNAGPEGNVSDAQFNDLYGTSSALTAQWNLGKKLFVRTGVGYHQLRQRFKLDREKEGYVTLSDHLIGVEQDSSGMVLPVYGEHEQVAIFSRTVEHYNRYKVLAVPVRIGYEHRVSDYVIQAAVGVDFQWVSAQDGKLLDSAGEVQLFDSSDGPLPAVTLGYALDMDFSREIDQRWSIGIRPGMIYTPEQSGQRDGISTQSFRWQTMLGIHFRLR